MTKHSQAPRFCVGLFFGHRTMRKHTLPIWTPIRLTMIVVFTVTLTLSLQQRAHAAVEAECAIWLSLRGSE